MDFFTEHPPRQHGSYRRPLPSSSSSTMIAPTPQSCTTTVSAVSVSTVAPPGENTSAFGRSGLRSPSFAASSASPLPAALAAPLRLRLGLPSCRRTKSVVTWKIVRSESAVAGSAAALPTLLSAVREPRLLRPVLFFSWPNPPGSRRCRRSRHSPCPCPSRPLAPSLARGGQPRLASAFAERKSPALYAHLSRRRPQPPPAAVLHAVAARVRG